MPILDYATKYLNKDVKVIMDRPLGSRHPREGFIYPVNYGFIPDTVAPDGHEIDVYVLGVFDPLEKFEGKCIAVIHRTNDEDDKLVVVNNGYNYNDDQIRALTEFQERFFESIVIRN